MQGQWLGKWEGPWLKVYGSVDGDIMVNIDETIDGYYIVAYIMPFNNKYPNSAVHIKTKDKKLNQKVTAYSYPFDPSTDLRSEWEEVKHFYDDDDVYFDASEAELKLKNNKLQISFVSNSGDKLTCTLEKQNKTNKSKITGELFTWDEFKELISAMEGSKYLFRGQQKPWKLRTTFHRNQRYVISEFINNDVKQLHHKLSAVTKHYFDLMVPEQKGAFIGLLQHNGYPTPLLDWSYSLYIAAFFAFRSWPSGYRGEGNIRIYIFDIEAWQREYGQSDALDPPFPSLSVMEFSSIDNPKVIPQQAATINTNIDDIESFILTLQKRDGVEYLKAIDIAASERDTAMRELRLMGITAGSMFPGIEGICEEFKEQNFEA